LTDTSFTTDHVPVPERMQPYYEQRGIVPGTLLITEGTFVDQRAAGYGEPGSEKFRKPHIKKVQAMYPDSGTMLKSKSGRRSQMLFTQRAPSSTASYGLWAVPLIQHTQRVAASLSYRQALSRCQYLKQKDDPR